MARRRMTCRRRERGFALFAVAFLVILMGGLAVGFLGEGLTARSWVDLHESNLHALEAAETGIARAETEIRSLVDFGTNGVGVVDGEIGNAAFVVGVFADPVSTDRWILRARGSHRMSRRRIEVGVRRRVNRRFVEGLFSQDDLGLNGYVQTDAYDSELGSYALQAINVDGAGTFAEPRGHIGSNAGIQLTGSDVWVRGNAIPGPLRTVEMSGGPTVLGDMTARRDLIQVAPAPYDEYLDAMLNNNNDSLNLAGPKVKYTAGSYSVTVNGGADVTLEPGTYFFTDFSVNGESIIRLSGPTKFYVTGILDLGGGTLLNPGAPADFQILGHPYDLPAGYAPVSTSISVSGGSDARMAIYAPGADLYVGGGNDFYGAAVAKSITVSGDCYFHYDKALGRIGLEGVATMERLYWREIAPPRR